MGARNDKVYDHTAFLNELTADKKLSTKELERQLKLFEQDYPEGYMTKDEFVEYYIQKTRKMKEKRGDKVKVAKQIFKIMDSDGSQTLSFKELISVIALRSQGSLDEKLTWAYKLYDADDSGTVTVDEVITMIRCVQGLTMKKKAEMLTKEEITAIFARGDEDKDGLLTVDEFIKRFKSSRTLMRIVTEYIR